MKRTILLLILLLLAAAPLSAQSKPAKGHFFAGYAFTRVDAEGKLDSEFNIPDMGNLNMNGFNVAFGVNVGNSSVTDDFSITFDIGGYFDRLDSIDADNTYLRLWTLTVGPQFTSRRHEMLHPFVRALVGLSYLDTKLDGAKENDLGFAFIGGGGLDIQMGEVAAWRVLQVDYLLARHASENLSSFRFATGIAFNF